MTHSIFVSNVLNFNFDSFIEFMGICDDIEYSVIKEDNAITDWLFYRKSYSSTQFHISILEEDYYSISIDPIATVDDYHFFPYLVDSFAKFTRGTIEDIEPDENIYHKFDDKWMEEMISEGVAYLKISLMLFPRSYTSRPILRGTCFSLELLNRFGITLHSSTPRIYGYIQYILANELYLFSSEEQFSTDYTEMMMFSKTEKEFDVPQHESIGKVKSWQLDGEETYESYSAEDVILLLDIAARYSQGEQFEGVVLNDIGTICQEGIGVERNGATALYWFEQALKAGDTHYAPTNIGDLYRKGCAEVEKSLAKAYLYYMKSDDPYAYYRIGEAFEFGWSSAPCLEKAMEWYEKAASAGHHLAIKRLQDES